MTKIKRRFEQFIFYDYAGIEHHLNDMAKKGWKLHKISPFYWEYHKIEPQNLIYSVTYFSEASEFNPYPTENQHIFYDYCTMAGWNLVTEWAQMQIFCSNEKDAMPIETEEAVKLKAIHKAMKKNFIPSNIVLLLLAIAQLILHFQFIKLDPISKLSDGSTLCMVAIFTLLFLQVLFTLTCYLNWYFRSKKAVEVGNSCIENKNGYRHFISLLSVLVLIAASFSMLSLSTKLFGWVSIWVVANFAVLIPLINLIKKTLKRAGVTRRINLIITIFSCFFFTFTLIFVMSLGIIKGLNAGWFGNKPDATYTTTIHGYSHDWDIYHHKLPLYVEDLEHISYDHYSYRRTQNNTILLSYSKGEQRSFPDGQEAPELDYEIVRVKIPLLYNICLKDYLEKYDYDYPMPEEERRYFKKINESKWQADVVYQLYLQDREQGVYILCKDDLIVYINFHTVPTMDQIIIAAEKLLN